MPLCAHQNPKNTVLKENISLPKTSNDPCILGFLETLEESTALKKWYLLQVVVVVFKDSLSGHVGEKNPKGGCAHPRGSRRTSIFLKASILGPDSLEYIYWSPAQSR